MQDRSFVGQFEVEARKAEREAQRAPDGSATRVGWLHVASAWRVLARRSLRGQSGSELPLHTPH